jgi:hypothetical protein
MTQADKLKAVIQKSIANGWVIDGGQVLRAEVYHVYGKRDWIDIWKSTDVNCDMSISRYSILFDHDFAKAFWGEEDYCSVCEASGHWQCGYPDTGDELKAWQYYLQQLVLQENYVDYLYSFIGGDK